MIQAYKKKKLLQGFSSDICRLPKPVASQQAAWGVNEKMEREGETYCETQRLTDQKLSSSIFTCCCSLFVCPAW